MYPSDVVKNFKPPLNPEPPTAESVYPEILDVNCCVPPSAFSDQKSIAAPAPFPPTPQLFIFIK